MVEFLQDKWWLLFPLAWFIFGGFAAMVNYYRQKNVLKIIKTYADRGEQPPEALLKIVEQPIDDRHEYQPGTRMNDGNGFSVVLFGVMAVGFGYASWSNMYGAGDAFLIVAFVMGALAAASLVSAVLGRRRHRD
ncbi:MAG: hypothetical protein KKA16_11925 [Alphaproteobacteria bacterium]|nr:hypothetical protein [Alphaproteobacteria bacterium]MBU2377727.1 hypothetical protein [Alphaproteobacteria bacterium]